ncbi:hypothetical protein [Edaphobacter albus]|uniref:hypothetical protein n=1 Tax=Edaphobacter sp. 4G125 TaxID=2763071 RepID=UPI001C99F217|nr:hypothetical protein [Edaphobacter sp. 4G125]
MLTFIWIGALFILTLVALFAYSSRNKKTLPYLVHGDSHTNPLTNTDIQQQPDRKRVDGRGDD